MKKSLLTIALLVFSVALFAQKVEKGNDKYGPFLTNKFSDNWFFSVGGGAQIYVGEYDHKLEFTKRLMPAFDISLGKWFTPVIGARIQYSGIQSKGLTDATGKFREGGIYKQNLYIEKFNSTNLHGDFLFNASNQFMGYKEDRFYQVVPFIGVGWAHAWKDGVQYTKDEITLTGGVINKFRINEALDFNVEIRGMLVNERFDGIVGDRFGEGIGTATIGITYKFHKRGFDRPAPPVVPDYTPYNKKIAELENQLSTAENKAKNLQSELVSEKNKPAKEVVKTEAFIPSLAIFFQINKYDLSDKDMINLGNIAEVIKKVPGKTYKIIGTADKQTGSAKHNQMLSEKRAQKVYDTLVNKFGVNPSQLQMDARGSQFQPFGKPYLNRVAIVEN